MPMTDGPLDQIIPLKRSTVDGLIDTALKSAINEDLKHEPQTMEDYAIIRAGAVERMSAFGEQLHAAELKVMRDMERDMSYNHLGFESLQDWINSLAIPENQADTLLRLARAVERIFILTDNNKWVTEDGEIITSDLLIEKASPSALMKMSFSFMNADEDQREKIATELLTGSSNARQIKRKAGVIDDVTLEAVVEIDGENKVYHFTLTPQHEAFLLERLRGSLIVRFTAED